MTTPRPLTMTTNTSPTVPDKSKSSVPIEKFGKDHWSTLLFLETCAVDNKGNINGDRMRCDIDIHPGLGNRCSNAPGMRRVKYPTRLKDGYELPNHDDWSCFEDLCAYGLVVWEGTGVNPMVSFTDEGRKVAALLRAHKAAGGTFKEMKPSILNRQ